MKLRRRMMVMFVALLAMCALPLLAQETVKESSTGKNFPKQVTFTHDGTEYVLSITGTAVRKKMVFKVYGIAHYLQDAAIGSAEEGLTAAMSGDKAKQITMDFARNVGPDKIQEAYLESFKKNATAEEMAEIQPLLDQFVGYFDKEVKENEQYILRWLPGGTVLAIIQGEEKPAITSETFARVLWSTWLGKNSIVDRNKLVALIASK